MRIESQIASATQEVRMSTDTGSGAGRQVLATSEPAGNNTAQTRSATVLSTSTEPSLATIQKPIDVKEAVEKLNSYVQSQKKSVNFSIDEATNSTVIKVFKSETGELIKQFPPEQILSMAARLRQSIGWMIDSKV